MLTKLLKYEFKATARTMIPFYIALLVLAVVNRISMLFQPNIDFFNISQALLVLLYGLFIGAVFVMTIVVMLQRFHKNLMGQEGYLMFTIPVTPAQNLLSKALVSLSWFLVSTICTFLSILILIPDYSDLTIFTREFSTAVAEVQRETGINLNIVFFLLLLLFIVGMVEFILQIYTAICIGHQSNSHKILVSFAAYVGIQIVLQTVGAAIISLTNHLPWFDDLRRSINSVRDAAPHLYVMLALMFVASIGMSIVYFFLSRHLLGKRLNLE